MQVGEYTPRYIRCNDNAALGLNTEADLSAVFDEMLRDELLADKIGIKRRCR